MKAHTELVTQLSTVLNASTLADADQLEALTIVATAIRRRMMPDEDTMQDWRTKRAAQGIVGSGKKAEAMREALKNQPKRRQ